MENVFTLSVQGMHCSSCETLIKEEIKEKSTEKPKEELKEASETQAAEPPKKRRWFFAGK